MQTKIIPNDTLMPAIWELLKEGHNVEFTVKGNSMLPFIKGMVDSVVVVPANKLEIKEGTIILALCNKRTYVLHRVLKAANSEGIITLMGDGNIIGTETCTIENVLGIATKVIKNNGKIKELGTKKELTLAKIWLALRPIRRYILAIYKRIIKV